MLKGKWITEHVETNKTVQCSDCLAVGFTNMGDSTCYINNVPVPPNGGFQLGFGNVLVNQSFDVRFIGPGVNNCIVAKTILLQDECGK